MKTLFDDDPTTRPRLWAPARRAKPARERKITTWAQLSDVLRRSPLLKTFTKSGLPTYTAGGRTCSPEVVEKALRWEFLIPDDPGIFGDDNAKTYKLKGENK